MIAPRVSTRSVLQWSHLGLTVTVVLFLVTRYDGWIVEKTAMKTEIESLRVQVASLEHRIDVQRTDISTLQKQMVDHLSADLARERK